MKGDAMKKRSNKKRRVIRFTSEQSEVKSKAVILRVTQTERDYLNDEAERRGMTVADLIRLGIDKLSE